MTPPTAATIALKTTISSNVGVSVATVLNVSAVALRTSNAVFIVKYSYVGVTTHPRTHLKVQFFEDENVLNVILSHLCPSLWVIGKNAKPQFKAGELLMPILSVLKV